MPYNIIKREDDPPHIWCLAQSSADEDLLESTAKLVRRSYGEDEILAEATTVMAPDIADGTFMTDHLVAAIRKGMPDPDAEGTKPAALTNYRSQTAEMVAKAALAVAYQFIYPAAPQQGAVNANQPILGFDGWGLLRQEHDNYILVLIQVKGTEEAKCPPSEAEKLAKECCKIPRDRSALSRGLCVLVQFLKEEAMVAAVMRMLELIGNDELPSMHIAPAIVRGTSAGDIEDLRPVRDVTGQFAPSSARGIVVMIGLPLADFGEVVMRKAREQ
jgi:hypothetical protein